MRIADVITSDAVRRATRARRAAFVAECVLYATSTLLIAGTSTLLWALGAYTAYLEPGGIASLVGVLLVVGAAATGALHRYRRPDRTVPIGLAVLVVEAIGLASPLGPLGPTPLTLAGILLELGPGPVLLAAVVRKARPVVGVLAAALAVGTAVTMGSFWPSTDGGSPVLRVWDLGPFVVVALVPVLVGVVLRSLDTARRTADLARVRAEDRLQVARELHDMLGNHVTGMTMYAQVAAADERVPEQVRELLVAIETTGGDALSAMRRMVGALRSEEGVGDLDVMPPAATTLDGAVREAVGPTPGVTVDVDATADAPAVVASVHRVVVEALTNVRRHAPRAATIRIAVTEPRAGRVAVEVVNDGVTGTARRGGPGFGLVGLRERVTALGGTLEAGPVDDGWRLRAELPHEPSRSNRSAAGLG